MCTLLAVDYKPLRTYGFIGNLGSCALVNLDGSVDWCCLPWTDSPSVFAALLDPVKGGRFSLAPAGGAAETTQEYLPDTNVLCTRFRTETGVLEVLDWMHMGGLESAEQDSHRLPALYRLARCAEGVVDLVATFDPRLDYGRATTELAVEDGCVTARGGEDMLRLYARCPFRPGPDGYTGTVRLRTQEQCTFLCAYGDMPLTDLPPPLRSLERTSAHWRRWLAEGEEDARRLRQRWREQVRRSSLVLRILAGGRGIAAAATTSLPEVLGGGDNWDYRFSWIRDTAFTVRALSALGHQDDAREFFEWLRDLLHTEGRRPADLRVLYPLRSASIPPEEELSHLRGYADSRPVRIGNAAAGQLQLDLFGEILNTLYMARRVPDGIDHILRDALRDIVNHVCDVWREPDCGIWELRDGLRHYTHSKAMCWLAIDRGLRLARLHGWEADLARWERERDAIAALVQEKGWDERRGAFMQSFGSDVLDASAVLFPLIGFLPADHPRMLSTLDAVERDLSDGALVYRSDRHRGVEGAFGFCSFWFVEALVLAGRIDDARERFDELLRLGNHVGLYAEEIDPASGAFLGNLPQAFTHVGLINAAVSLSRALTEREHRQ
ncbi:MAG: glycoside hydrolase family 15 protein [Candidatus Peribacteraceae bacterium]|nr:glycoside hydrolase family 15 protein [Candidatus Peribacteraceae bacterium]